MEAKDTVMDTKQKKIAGGYDPLIQVYVTPIDIYNIQQKLCEKQAEITGRVMYDEGFKAGMKEVVEWLKGKRVVTDLLGAARFYASNEEWQAKLKEWGVGD